MKLYQYKAINSKGDLIVGTLKSYSRVDSQKKLKKKHLLVVELEEIFEKESKFTFKSQAYVFLNKNKRYKLTQKQILQLTISLLELVGANVMIAKAFSILLGEEKDVRRRAVLEKINDRLQSGDPLSHALRQAYDNFDSLYISLIMAGEKSGCLHLILKILVAYLDRNYKLRKKVITAMIYPGLVGSVCFLVVISLLFFVVPQFTSTLKSLTLGKELPRVTMSLMYMSDCLNQYWGSFLASFLGLVIIGIVSLKKIKTDFLLNTLAFKMPGLKDVITDIELSRLAYVLSILLRGGVVLNEALLQLQGIAKTKYFQKAIKAILDSLYEGEILSSAFEKTKAFPSYFCLICKVGEESGELSQALDKAALYYQEQLETSITRVITFLEPMLILFLAGIVGSLMVVLFLPILQLIQQFSDF